MKERKIFSAVHIIFIILAAVLGVSAQVGTTSITGTVTDAQGKVIPSATVTLINENRNIKRSVTTNDSGGFSFNALPPDAYTVETELSGFKKSVLTDIKAAIDTPQNLNILLEIGDVSEVVTVQASGTEVSLNTQDATIGNTIVSVQITELPLEARSPASLLTLQPGVTREGYVTGARSDQSNITLDGVDINNAETNSINGPVLRLNAEAVEEFRVVTSNPNANQGRSSGAQISLATKAGTNDFHGRLFWFHRNTVFTANDFFSNAAGNYTATDSNVINGFNKVGEERTPRPKLLRNTFGASLGGPIIKDRAFFFYSYEGRRDASESVYSRQVPLANLGEGVLRFPDANGNIVSLTPQQFSQIYASAGLNQNAVALFRSAAAKYPSNFVGDGYNTGNYRFNLKTPTELSNHILRLDANLTRDSRHQLSIRGNYQQDVISGARYLPDTPAAADWSHPIGLMAAHTWTINNNLINVARYGLTRSATSSQGDSSDNLFGFRFIYQPLSFTRTFDRTIPVHNITDDLTWIKGNHSFQFGTNIRTVRNTRTTYSASFDSAIVNNQYYAGSGNSLLAPLSAAGYTWRSGYANNLQSAVAALIGRFTQYTANYNYDLDGKPIPAGTGVKRTFATEEFDFYGQDIWRISPGLTVTLGLRYSLSRPVYEAQGYMAASRVPLGEFLQKRLDSAARGVNYTDQIVVDLAGQKYDKPGFYPMDKNNFQPRVAVAWSPNFSNKLLKTIFGSRDKGESVIRGGFGITNDYFGQALAVQFNANNTLGFASSFTNNANSFNVTNSLGPLYTGSTPDIRSFPGVVTPTTLTFPQVHANSRAIESSLDSNLVSPINYSWNASFSRTLPYGLTLEASYIGRSARNLLLGRDVMSPNLNFTDPKSGATWSQAAAQLEQNRRSGVAGASIQPIPFFENLYTPASLNASYQAAFRTNAPAGWSNTRIVYDLLTRATGRDYTNLQEYLDVGTPYFYHPQYGALAVFSTIGSSDYHAGALTVRQRLGSSFIFDFNYTLSKSIDDASGLQSGAAFNAGSFIVNPGDLKQQRTVSDFDTRHVVSSSAVWQLPLGRNKFLFGEMPKYLDAVLGGWQLSGIFRWNSGLPLSAPLDYSGWASNYNRRNFMIRITEIETSPNRGTNGALPNNFSDPLAAWKSFRNTVPGESGERNILRYPGYVNLDLGLAKYFSMPWSDSHKLQFRWEVFNATNTQRFTGISSWTQTMDPYNATSSAAVPPNFGQFTTIQGSPRVMQLGLRYIF